MVRVGDVARIIEKKYPLPFAYEGDNCGLQVGRRDAPVRGVLVALDPSATAVEKAAAAGADLLVTHHPLFHGTFSSIDTAGPVGSAAAAALAAGIAVYSAHTNLDAAPGGLAAEVARRAGLGAVRHFGSAAAPRQCKVVVFVPQEAADRVREAMSAAGAGVIGAYDRCAFTASGTGVFRAGEGASPVVGKRGRLAQVPEIRLEMTAGESVCQAVVEAAVKAHPYEEPAVDVYPLRREAEGGAGCMGQVAKVPFAKLAERLAEVFRAPVRISGKARRQVERIAVVPGSGGSLLGEALRLGADVMVTGEVRYHQMLEAEHGRLGIIELGHDGSEMPAVDLLARLLARHQVVVKGDVKISKYKRKLAVRPL